MKAPSVAKPRQANKAAGAIARSDKSIRHLNRKGIAPNKLPSANSMIARRDFVALVVQCHIRLAIESHSGEYATTESMMLLQDRVKHRVSSAKENHKLLESKPGWIRFGDAATWARIAYPAECAAFPMNPVVISGQATMQPFTASAHGHMVPKTLPECRASLQKLYIENAKLAATNAALEGENMNLHQRVAEYENRARARSKKAKEAGEKGGRGNHR